MKTLVAVKSCEAHRGAGFHIPILNTWGKDLPKSVDLRFFIGTTNEVSLLLGSWATEVLETPDDYNSLPLKTKAILVWFLNTDYDRVFLVDTDSYIDHRFFSLVLNYDYIGKIDREAGVTFPYTAVDREGNCTFIPECYPWASGGFGYMLSRKAAEIVVATEPMTWAEDLYVGQALGPHIKSGEITMRHITGYTDHFPQREWQRGYTPSTEWMELCHEARNR